MDCCWLRRIVGSPGAAGSRPGAGEAAASENAAAALAIGRRARHGEPGRARDVGTLRVPPVATRGESVRSIAAAVEYDAAVALRGPVRGEAQAHRRNSRLGARLQQRDDE